MKLIGGVDLSFVNGSLVDACAALVVLSFPDLKVVYENYELIELTAPYVSGFLAFREVPSLAKLINNLKATRPQLVPQILFVDGNGVLHPRGFGLASHLGVVCDLPTVGIAKNLMAIDGLNRDEVLRDFAVQCTKPGDSLPLIGDSKRVWGAALRTTSRPVFVSCGHRVSLESALVLTAATAQFHIPEATRQADLRSRQYLRDRVTLCTKCARAVSKAALDCPLCHTPL